GNGPGAEARKPLSSTPGPLPFVTPRTGPTPGPASRSGQGAPVTIPARSDDVAVPDRCPAVPDGRPLPVRRRARRGLRRRGRRPGRERPPRRRPEGRRGGEGFRADRPRGRDREAVAAGRGRPGRGGRPPRLPGLPVPALHRAVRRVHDEEGGVEAGRGAG